MRCQPRPPVRLLPAYLPAMFVHDKQQSFK